MVTPEKGFGKGQSSMVVRKTQHTEHGITVCRYNCADSKKYPNDFEITNTVHHLFVNILSITL